MINHKFRKKDRMRRFPFVNPDFNPDFFAYVSSHDLESDTFFPHGLLNCNARETELLRNIADRTLVSSSEKVAHLLVQLDFHEDVYMGVWTGQPKVSSVFAV